MEAGAYLPRPVVVAMMLKTHLKRRFWPAASSSTRFLQRGVAMIWTLAARQRSTVRARTCCDYRHRLLRPVDSWREGRIWSG